jgi:hypothetical protein
MIVTIIAPITRCSLDGNIAPFAQPDYETRHQRIGALFSRVICEKIAPRAHWRMRQPKFFKMYRRLAAPLIERKSRRVTATYGWRREWDSNPRYGFPYTRFPSVRLQPLGHPSAKVRAPARLRAKGARTIVAGGGVATRSRPPGTARSRPPIMAPDHGPQSRAHCRLFGL